MSNDKALYCTLASSLLLLLGVALPNPPGIYLLMAWGGIVAITAIISAAMAGNKALRSKSER